MSRQMRISVKTSWSVAHELFSLFLVAIRAIATRPELFFAKETFATADGEGDDHTIAFFKFGNRASNFYYFAHRFVAEDVAFFHRGHVMIVKRQDRYRHSGACSLKNELQRT